MSRRVIYSICLAVSLGLVSTASGQTGEILIEWWTGIAGSDLRDLWDNANYPDNPAGSAYLSSLEVPQSGQKPPELADLVDDYGARIRGYFHPPVTGEYTFWLVSDDEGRLYLSPQGSSHQKVEIARVLAYTGFNEWTKYLGQKSVPISLEAGKKYYIEAVYKEGTGGDHLQVAYGPAGAQTVIPGSQLSPWDSGIAKNPTPGDGGVVEQNFAALGWSAGPGAVQHDVYFGTSVAEVTAGTAGTAKGRQPNTFYYAGNLVPGTTYYWRIDEVEASNKTHTGEVWSFTVAPAKATNPSPAVGARWVASNVKLSWRPGFAAIFHHVYFGTNQADVLAGTGGTSKGQQAETTYTPGALAADTTYYWRIDEFDGTTTHKGDLWRFRTEPAITIYDPNLVGWWKLDNEGTGTVIDYSGYGHHGTFRGEPIWVPGYDGDALEFNGRDDWVNIDGYKGVLGGNPFTITAWIRCQGNGVILSWGNASGRQRVEFRVATSQLRCEHGSGNIQGNTNVNDNEWHHVAMTVIRGATISHPDVILWLDGQDDTQVTSDPDTFNLTANFDVKMAQRYNIDNSRMYPGALDDVRLYNRVLTQEEISNIMLRPDPRPAWRPHPANGTTVDIEHVLPISWSPGENAAKHDVYFGTDELAVTDAGTSDTSGAYRGRQDANTYNPPEGVLYDQTYFWRVDEYNTDGTVSRGRVWSFTVGNFLIVDDFESYTDDVGSRIFQTWRDGWGFSEPAPGYPGNGTGSAVGYAQPPFAEQSIVHGGSQSMPLIYDNTGATGKARYSETQREWASPQDWTRHGVKALTVWFRGNLPTASTFSEGPVGTYTMTARSANIYDTADHFNYLFKRLSGVGTIEVKLESVTNTAADAKFGVMVRETLDPSSTNAFVFFRPDGGVRFNRRLTAGDTTSGFDPGGTYTLPHWLRLERYLGGSVRAWHSSDGSNWEELDTQVTVQMANDVYIGLALASNNTAAICTAVFSEVITTGAVTGQWQAQDIGITSNIAEQLYVAVEDSTGKSKVVNHQDPNATLLDTWQEWNIDTKEFSNAGVNRNSIKKMYIGVGNRVSPKAGGTGTLYIDDVLLYRPRCVPSLLKPAASFNNDCVVNHLDLEIMSSDWLKSDYSSPPLMAWYKFDGNASDSSANGRNGTATGAATYAAGKFGQAISLDGSSFVEITGYKGILGGNAFSIAAWVKSTTTGDATIVCWGTQTGGQRVDFRLYQGRLRVEHGNGNLQGNTIVADGQWHHVALTVTQNAPISYPNVKLYLDGKDDSQTTTDPDTFNIVSNVDVNIGRRGTNNDRAFTGFIDDVRIYDKAISASEIASITDGSLGSVSEYHPLTLPANMYDAEPQGFKAVNLKDYAVLVDMWLDEMLWPQP